MSFSFKNIFYHWDSDGILHLHFESIDRIFLSSNGSTLHTKKYKYLTRHILTWKWNTYDLRNIQPNDRIIIEIRRNEMFETYFLLKNKCIIKQFTAGHTEKGFIYTFDMYSSDEKYYQEELISDFEDSKEIDFDFT